jgi:hypothetical protein
LGYGATANPRHGFVVKDANETTLNQGGVRYEASRAAYNGETVNYPQLVVTYGRPSVTLSQITTVNATGAQLSWTPYIDPTPGSDPSDDLAEYQVYRSVNPAFTPDASTLIAPVAAGTTSYTDSSEPPTPPGQTPNAFYYMVAVKTADGQVVPGPTQLVQLPNAGFTQKIIDASGATTLSQAQPSTNEQHLSGQPWLAVGNANPTYGVTRTVLNYPSMASLGIPTTATVASAQLKLWGWYNNNQGGAAATYDVHALTQDFDPATATWNNASTGTPWTTAGGAFSSTVTGSVTGLTSAPAADEWPVTSTVQGWVTTPSSEHGLLLQLHAESGGILEQELFLDTSAAEAALHPELVVTYTDPTPENTYYVPSLPDPMSSATSYTVPVTLTNTTTSTWSRKDWVLSYHWLLPDGTDVSNSGNQVQTSLGADMAPGAVATVSASVKAPDTSGSGGARTGYQIAWDMYDKATGTWLSAGAGGEAVAPLDQPASVEQAGSNQLGLEKFYQCAHRLESTHDRQ